MPTDSKPLQPKGRQHAMTTPLPVELDLRVPRKLLMATNPVNLEVSKDSKRKPTSALRCGVCGPL